MRRIGRVRIAVLVVAVLLLALLAWLATTDDVRVWPLRNTVQYRVLRWWWAHAGLPESGAPGTLGGTVRDPQGRALPDVRVLVARWDGTTYTGVTDANGRYVISDIPSGRYAPVAGAPGYQDTTLGDSLVPWPPFLAAVTRRRVPVLAGQETPLDAVLPAETAHEVPPGTDLHVGAPNVITCQQPIPSQARRQEVTFNSAGRRNQLTLLYTPSQVDAERSPHPSPLPEGEGAIPASPRPRVSASGAVAWPLLLTVYPGPADEWECASLPLAQSGYAVLAAGPAYSFDLERDVDELACLLGFARAGQLPGVDADHAAALAGSYSALHVLHLLSPEHTTGASAMFQAVVLLGPPANLFDMRRRYEDGTFIPPFGLDQALVALGLPDRAPLRYWRYSGVYHVRRDWPPMLLVHSRDDPVVPYQQSEQLAAALAAAGVPHDLHVFETAGHYLLSEGAETEAIYRLTLDFLATRLGNK